MNVLLRKCAGDQPSSSHPSILAPLLTCLISQQPRLPWSTEIASAPKAFRVCMANVLISVCQKVALGARTVLASRMILPLVNFVQVTYLIALVIISAASITRRTVNDQRRSSMRQCHSSYKDKAITLLKPFTSYELFELK